MRRKRWAAVRDSRAVQTELVPDTVFPSLLSALDGKFPAVAIRIVKP